MLNVYFFQWPSDLGGADTRLKDLISCFNAAGKYRMYSIPNDDFRLKEQYNIDYLLNNNVCPLSWRSLPEKSDGIAISFCNFRLFSERWRVRKIHSMGLKFIWSNDMMWRGDGELQAIRDGFVNATIFTSEKHLEKTNDTILKNTKQFIVPNYFHLDKYPYVYNSDPSDYFSIGKHSRADKVKFSSNFPIFYESLGITNPKFRVMGFSEEIKKLFSWFNFSEDWDLLDCNQEPTVDFLGSLNAYVYNCHHTFTESQCRSTIESLLCGVPVIAPKKINFIDQIWHGKNGFICEYFEDYKKAINKLQSSRDLRQEMSHNARSLSIPIWCDSNRHLGIWEKIFEYIL
jgi:hypothetical protein